MLKYLRGIWYEVMFYDFC